MRNSSEDAKLNDPFWCVDDLVILTMKWIYKYRIVKIVVSTAHDPNKIFDLCAAGHEIPQQTKPMRKLSSETLRQIKISCEQKHHKLGENNLVLGVGCERGAIHN